MLRKDCRFFILPCFQWWVEEDSSFCSAVSVCFIFDYWTGNGGLVKGSAVALLRGFMAMSGGA